MEELTFNSFIKVVQDPREKAENVGALLKKLKGQEMYSSALEAVRNLRGKSFCETALSQVK